MKIHKFGIYDISVNFEKNSKGKTGYSGLHLVAYVLKCATTIESVKAAEQAGEEAKVVSGIDT